MKTIKELEAKNKKFNHTYCSHCWRRQIEILILKDVLGLIDEWWNLKSSTIEELKARING